MKPEPPFNLGVDFAGVVLDPGSSDFTTGQRVAGVAGWGNAAEVVASPKIWTFPLPDALVLRRGRRAADELPHRAVRAQGPRRHQRGRHRARARRRRWRRHRDDPGRQGVRRPHHRRRQLAGEGAGRAGRRAQTTRSWSTGSATAVKELTGGRGVDIVLDVVGGDLFTDSLRCLAEQGRLLVVGFAAGQGIPEVKVNRLLLNNIDVRGVGWGAYAMTRQDFMQQQWRELVPMIETGVVKPPIGATYDMDGFGQALVDMAERKTLGKSVVRVRA